LFREEIKRRRKKMKILGNKKVSTVAFVLVLTAATLTTFLPIVSAGDVVPRVFMSFRPNPIGVGQELLINLWVQPQPPPGAHSGDPGSINIGGSNYFVYWDMTIEVTDSDGDVEILGPFNTDPSGGHIELILPDKVGTWYIQGFFPAQTVGGNDYAADTTPTMELTVQQEEIPHWPGAALPTDYWTRPISSENREWSSIAGPWLESNYAISGKYNPYTTAPNTAHIVWTRQVWEGGIVGEPYGDSSFYNMWRMVSPPVIINGLLYFNTFSGHYGGPRVIPPGVTCLDLRTGEVVWQRDDIPSITCGQVAEVHALNANGAFAYLWSLGGTYVMYDAFSGEKWATFENASTGSLVMGPMGELLVYVLDCANGWCAMWNSTKALGVTNSWDTPQGAVFDWKDGLEWNYTGNTPLSGVRASGISENVIVAKGRSSAYNLYAGYSLETGELLWGILNLTMPGVDARAISAGIFAQFDGIDMTFHGYNAYTGTEIWESDPKVYPWGTYTDNSPQIALGRLFSTSYSGYIYAFNISNGKLLWKFSSGNAGYETPYGTWPFFGTPLIADGKVFGVTSEHTPNDPLYRGEGMYAIDIDTGEGIWNISGWFASGVVAEGHLLSTNGYDGLLYCFGKGKTATTVSVAPAVVADGSSVMITGTVTDQSPGAEGTPAVSDEDMTEWMEYLYMQQPCPADVTGVPVSLDTCDPNGNWFHIGDVTSDRSGMFKMMWEPEHEGEYTVVATFGGSESYWASYAETAIGVGPAAPEPTEPTEPAVPGDIDRAVDNLTPILYGTIVAVVVAIVIGIVNLWALRKRP
jgi:outer membrane protein assembly factor BamB